MMLLLMMMMMMMMMTGCYRHHQAGPRLACNQRPTVRRRSLGRQRARISALCG
jgi:hypothetical protein